MWLLMVIYSYKDSIWARDEFNTENLILCGVMLVGWCLHWIWFLIYIRLEARVVYLLFTWFKYIPLKFNNIIWRRNTVVIIYTLRTNLVWKVILGIYNINMATLYTFSSIMSVMNWYSMNQSSLWVLAINYFWYWDS